MQIRVQHLKLRGGLLDIRGFEDPGTFEGDRDLRKLLVDRFDPNLFEIQDQFRDVLDDSFDR